MRLRKEYQAVIDELVGPLDPKWTVVHGGKHPILHFKLKGKEWKFPLPGSSSDPTRTVQHTRAKLQRKIKCIEEGRLYGGCS